MSLKRGSSDINKVRIKKQSRGCAYAYADRKIRLVGRLQVHPLPTYLTRSVHLTHKPLKRLLETHLPFNHTVLSKFGE